MCGVGISDTSFGHGKLVLEAEKKGLLCPDQWLTMLY